MCPRPLIQEGDSGPDVMDALLRLNLGGAHPQLPLSDTFDSAMTGAAKVFQANHGLVDDGDIGTDTWGLLDQLDGGRLDTAAQVADAETTRQQARALLDQGDFAGAHALLKPLYARPGLTPEARVRITAGLGWAEHGLGNFDRAFKLYVEQLLVVAMLGNPALVVRDTLQRIREVTLGQPPGPLPSDLNKQNLPPNG